MDLEPSHRNGMRDHCLLGADEKFSPLTTAAPIDWLTYQTGASRRAQERAKLWGRSWILPSQTMLVS